MSSKLRKLALELSGEKQKRRQANKIKKLVRQHKHHKHKHVKEFVNSSAAVQDGNENTSAAPTTETPDSVSAEHKEG